MPRWYFLNRKWNRGTVLLLNDQLTNFSYQSHHSPSLASGRWLTIQTFMCHGNNNKPSCDWASSVYEGTSESLWKMFIFGTKLRSTHSFFIRHIPITFWSTLQWLNTEDADSKTLQVFKWQLISYYDQVKQFYKLQKWEWELQKFNMNFKYFFIRE